jgi:hypothetical protein
VSVAAHVTTANDMDSAALRSDTVVEELWKSVDVHAVMSAANHVRFFCVFVCPSGCSSILCVVANNYRSMSNHCHSCLMMYVSRNENMKIPYLKVRSPLNSIYFKIRYWSPGVILQLASRRVGFGWPKAERI